jgi:enoyl-CoA hydratase
MLDELDACWTRAAEDEDVRVIVLKANGKHFSSGHDINIPKGEKPPADSENKGLEAIIHYERVRFLGYSRKWRDVPKPSIAAVQGACIAAGMMLCWPCDLIVAADNAKFSDPVVMMGIGGVEYHGHTWELGARKAKELLFTAKPVDAYEAEKRGMVNRVVPLAELDSASRELALEIAQMHPHALAMAKRAVNATLDVQGQHNALQHCFDLHQLGHNSAHVQSGQFVLVGLQGMKQGIKEGAKEKA